MPPRPSQPKPTRWLRRLSFIVVTDLVLLALLEWGLGFFFPPYYVPVVQQEQLARAKPAGEKRIFVYGESTIHGYPYGAKNSTARWLELILRDVLASEQIRVVNFGRSGRGTYHLVNALEDTVAHEPDVVIASIGHNEFLPWQLALVQGAWHRWGYFHVDCYRAIYEASTQGRDKSGAKFAGIPPWSGMREQVLTTYAANMERLIEVAQQRDVPILLCIPACNLSGLPPQQSQFSPGEREANASQVMRQLRKAARQHRVERAHLQAATALDTEFGDLHFWLGRALDLDGRHDEAYEAFAKARDLDCLPFRCQGRQISDLREISRRCNVPLIDFPAVFRAAAGDRAPGMAQFLDPCHPRPHGQYLMALAMAKRLCAEGQLAPADAWHWYRLPTYETCLERIGLTAEDWRAPDRRGILAAVVRSPDVALELGQHLPPLMQEPDAEWRALRLLAQWGCKRHAEVRQVWSSLATDERAAYQACTDQWTPEARESWQEMMRELD